MEKLNLPPFVIGDNVVCISENNYRDIKKGLVYKVRRVFKTACCNSWLVDVGVPLLGNCICGKCGNNIYSPNGFQSIRFSKVQEQKFKAITFSEIEELQPCEN